MALKYINQRQLNYGGQQGTNVWARFPSNARPIATAPVTATPIRVFDSTGKSQWALHHMGGGGHWHLIRIHSQVRPPGE